MKKIIFILPLLFIFSCEQTTEPEPKDCAGVANGDAEVKMYYFDADGDGLGAGEGSEFCNATVSEEWVMNSNDADDDCTSNYYDCFGVCDGDAFENECGCIAGSTGLDSDYCYTCVDIDGNEYQTILMNERVWMAENLKVTHYNNGDEILTNLDNSNWANPTEGAYTFPIDTQSFLEVYGNLYNWYAVGDARGICPDGWIVPSGFQRGMFSDELNDYFGSNAGGKMKECTEGSCPESEYWSSPNLEATNESGFTGLPSGRRGIDGNYEYMGYYAFFWTSTAWNEEASFSELQYNANELRAITGKKELGLSIRCVFDINE
jgi:uncharacterized protein (TIGR02145 family)